MPSTENATLDRIQREIMDVMEREKELRNNYNNNNNNDEEIKTNGETVPQPLTRAQSTSVLTEPQPSKPINFRRFAPNGNTKGVMQRFLKSRGKLNVVNTLKEPTHRQSQEYFAPQEFSPLKVSEPGKRNRNGFIPIEERMRKEIQEAQNREIELRSQRRKSNPDFESLLDMDLNIEQPRKGGLRASKSLAQLTDCCENLDDPFPPPASLKSARSLAELCDADEDEIIRPQSIILQFENMITKSQQART